MYILYDRSYRYRFSLESSATLIRLLSSASSSSILTFIIMRF